jgi:exopolysaccharide biosynthesis protein
MFKFIGAFFVFGLTASQALAASSIVYEKVNAVGTVAHVVTVDLHNPDVRVSVALASGGRGKAETFKSMIKRTRPRAALTGTFFDTKTLIPTGDIAVFGTLVSPGCIGSALCIDSDNKPSVVSLKTGRMCKWTGYETVLCAGPTLVSGGKSALALRHEGFRNSLHSPSRRTAVGLTKSGKLLMVAINRRASLYTLARLMVKLNATDALCLDGGSSTAFYHNGSFVAVPGRTLTNCLVVYAKSEDYHNAKTALAPARLFASAK